MEYLPGHAMDYHTELMLAAPCLADIHSVPIPESEEILIHPQNPLKAILEECEEMFKVYLESPLGDGEKKHISVNFWILAGNGKQKSSLKVVINAALIQN